MIKLKIFVLIVMTCLGISSCSTALDDYQEVEKPFDIKEYFDGNVIAYGIVQDYSNKVSRRFCVELEGTWQGDQGVLAEKFYFNDGEITYRNWQLSKKSDGSYEGQAEDVVGTAIGKHQGFAFQFQYQLSLVVEEDTYQVSMDDWMYQLDEHRVMNKTSMSKLGVKVAEVTLFFDKQTQVQECPTADAI
ncbi:DUF3833 domain-containing protein [Colwellia sp. 12G3]|uniref:DUF3833 domain-containing protein n=1 Tax=Colwellia sp. 12G3 TaxID=2058299 RepID=UPI000C3406BF|nr:DUF3833 domain-containing protein [Colwellia sp. 12G3]PKI14852.1 DUF3833 domain-containing protein [Colwellia sp. 12G3]